LQYKDLTIDGFNFTLNTYPIEKGLENFHKLSGVLGPVLSELKAKNLDEEVGLEIIGNALHAFSRSTTSENFVSILKDVFYGIVIHSEAGKRSFVLNAEFNGKYLLIFELAKEQILFQFKDFLAGMTGFAGKNPVVKQVVKVQAR
jgi:hypothetical protein